MLCHNQGLTVEYYNIRKPLYDNYYLTDLGIFTLIKWLKPDKDIVGIT